jgi:serine/threonine protein phosphatase PrpC
LDNDRIINKIWESKKKGQIINDIHSLCGKITDAIIKYSMEKNSFDNVTVIFIAFKNFERKMKDPYFEYKYSTKCVEIQDNYDFSTN